jgi:hypothetical protein
MPKIIIEKSKLLNNSNSTFESVNWPEAASQFINNKVVALQTTRLAPSTLSSKNFIDKANQPPKIIAHQRSYDHFNLGLHVGDDEANVKFNRQLLSQTLAHKISSNKLFNPKRLTTELSDLSNIQWLNQVHGNQVVTVSRISSNPITADASITREKKLALAIMTADCLPILLSHRNGDEVAAIHGGWRCLEAGIIKATLGKMLSKSNDVVAWLGPCIGKKAFQVGAKVRNAFIDQDINLANGFIRQQDGKFLADLHFIATHQLRLLGVQHIATLPECTFHNENKYYSYRRNTITGRMASVISIC